MGEQVSAELVPERTIQTERFNVVVADPGAKGAEANKLLKGKGVVAKIADQGIEEGQVMRAGIVVVQTRDPGLQSLLRGLLNLVPPGGLFKSIVSSIDLAALRSRWATRSMRAASGRPSAVMELSSVAIGIRHDMLPVLEAILHFLMGIEEKIDRNSMMGKFAS